MKKIFHITQSAVQDSARASGQYQPAAFAEEGFVHCSFLEQLIPVCNRLFRGQQNLVVLEIDVSRLGCEVVLENLEGGNELYPHVYGPIPWDAVVAVHELGQKADGCFNLPDSVRAD